MQLGPLDVEQKSIAEQQAVEAFLFEGLAVKLQFLPIPMGNPPSFRFGGKPSTAGARAWLARDLPLRALTVLDAKGSGGQAGMEHSGGQN